MIRKTTETQRAWRITEVKLRVSQCSPCLCGKNLQIFFLTEVYSFTNKPNYNLIHEIK